MKTFFIILALFSLSDNICFAQEPYKLGVQENIQGTSNSYSSYPSPQMIVTPPVKQKKTLHASVDKQSNPPQNTYSAGITTVALPPAFLGVWQVHGQRTTVDALPEFQASAQQAFAMSNDQIWNIAGSQSNGYTLGSNTGISTALIVDKVEGNTAFVRYQHPIGNTMAQEAIVLSLLPNGTQFDGLERVSIVKQGLPQPRAKVTYKLTGFRKQ